MISPLFGAACQATLRLIPSLYRGLQCDPADGSLQFQGINDFLIIAGNLISILLVVAGFAAVVMTLVGGIMLMTSQGQPARLVKARKILTAMVVGLILVTGLYSIINLIIGTVTK